LIVVLHFDRAGQPDFGETEWDAAPGFDSMLTLAELADEFAASVQLAKHAEAVDNAGLEYSVELAILFQNNNSMHNICTLRAILDVLHVLRRTLLNLRV
jgi:hypothetical protein